MTRQILFIIQYVSIVGLVVECWVIFQKWRSELHSYIFFSSIATLVNNYGYLLLMRATTGEACLTAMKTAYLGKVWIPYALFMFAMLLCGKRVNKWIKGALAIAHLVTLTLMLTVEYNDLYYTNIDYDWSGLVPRIVHGGGVWHKLYDVIIAFYIVYALVQMFLAWYREKRPLAKKRLMTLIMTFMAYSGSFGIYKLAKTWSYDVTAMGYTIGTVFLFIAIFRFDLLDTVALAREYAIDKLAEGIVVVNDLGKVGYYNKPALELFPALETDAQSVMDALRGAIDRGEPLRLDGRVYTPTANALSGNDASAGTIYVLTDDTEHFRYVEQLEEQTRRADSASKAKSAFLANMSHEIRTPINAILGMDEMILRESEEKSTLAYAEDIESAGRTLLSIINDVLDFSKIEEGRMEILPTAYDISSLINDLVNMTRPRAEDKGLSFDVRVDKNIPCRLIGDEIRIRQCALNVLTNAVKYTEKGGVTLDVGYEWISRNNIMLRIAVTDTGIGMRQEDMDRLFAPFARIEEKRNRAIEGTGLGMSITKQLLALMGSRLEVESVYGEGSTFSFKIDQPVINWEGVGEFAEHVRTDARRRSYRERFHAPEARVLVVDDTPVNLTVVRGLLKKTQIQVDTAESGREALALAAENRYDVVFIDHMMPEMDGMETLRELRKLPDMADVPCVALTANAISGAREMYLEAGFSDYLSKPLDGEKLEALLLHRLPPEMVREPEEDAGAQDEPVTLPEWLNGIAELDVRQGLTHCGTAETYLDSLTIYARNASASADELERLRGADDARGVTVKVHALKSTSRAVGAEELGAAAEKLENAGNAGDAATLYAGLDDVLARLRALGEALAPLYAEDTAAEQTLPPLPEGKLQSICESIRTFADSFDSEGAMSMLDYLDGFDLPPDERERVEKIRRAVADFDWDCVGALLQ